MNLSIDGYKNNSKDSKNPYNIIPGNKITMQGVSKKLTLIPIVGGKPRYDLKVLAKPGDSDFEFGSDVEAVLELPFAQYQYGVLNPYQPSGFADESVQQGDFITYPQYGKNPQFIQGLDQYGTQKYTVGNNGFNVNSYNNDSIQINTDFLNSNPVLDPIQKAMVSASEQNSADNKLMDPNLRQKMEIKKQGRLSDLRFIGASNPYGGWNMANSAAYLGASIQRKDPLGIVGSAGKILLEGFRNGMSGAAAVKRFNKTEEEKKKNQYEALLNQGIQYAQKGGRLEGKLLTGNYIKGNPEHPNPNAEVERGEYTQTPDGNVQEILGDRHSEGGELVDMPNGTKVVSDYLKIGAKNAKYFKNEFGLNVKSGSTFATVLDKYKSKIGLSKLLDKESTIMTKIVDQENIDNGQTRDINLQVLSENVNELKPEKEKLESKFNEFTSHVFDIQESYKEETGVVDDTTEKQMGGDVQQSGEPDLEQLIVAYAQLKGVDPQEVIAQLQQLDETQIQQALQQMVSELQGGNQPQPEQQPQMQYGGIADDNTQNGDFTTNERDINSLSKKEIIELQKNLIASGYSVGKTGADGIIGKNTLRALNEFKAYNPDEYQLQIGLTTDYIPKTRQSDIANKPSQTSSTKPSQASSAKTGQNPSSSVSTVTQNSVSQKNNIQQPTQKPKGKLKDGYYKDVNIIAYNGVYYTPYQFQKMVMAKDNSGATNIFGASSDELALLNSALKINNKPLYKGRSNGYGNWKNQPSLYMNKSNDPLSSLDYQGSYQKGGIVKHQSGSRVYDEGYVPTTAQLADPVYNAIMIQQGKSILGATDVEGQTYNPGSLLSTQAFMADTDTLSLFNPNYNPTKLKTSLANAKSDSERFAILNKWGQKERQNAFLEKASPELAGYVGMGYAPTQTQLQGIYDGLSKSKQAEFTDVLLKSNWGIKDGKIYGGNYKYNSDYKKGEALYDYIDKLASTDSDLYNKIGRLNIADGVYDRRRENFRTMDFASVAERDAYAEKHGFKKFGNVWVDPENRNNIILPRVFRNMVVDKNKIGEYNTNKNIGPIDGYKNFGLDGVYEKWSTVPDGDQTKNPNTDDNGLTPPDLSAYRQNPQLPMMTPDQSNLPPIYLEGTMRQLDNVQSNTVRVSPMNTLKELSKQYSTAQRLASETNPYTSGAIMANMQAQQMDAINNANMQAEIANQQDERNVANINEDRISKVEQANKAMAAQYERDTIVGQDNLYNEWRNYIDNNNRINVANWNLQNQVNMSNAMNQNYQIGVDGAITQTDQPQIFFHGGVPYLKDPKTGKMTEVTVTKKDNKGKIETTQTTKSEFKQKKGGRLTKPFKLK